MGTGIERFIYIDYVRKGAGIFHYRIDIDDLKAFADKYNYPWDQQLADQAQQK